jgi:branched-chain amino acid transport system substrate-binding protein
MIGGAMVGLQSTSIKAQLGPLLNGWTNYDFWLPTAKMNFPGVSDLMRRYQDRAGAEGADPLGYYVAPLAYAQMQVLEQAIQSTMSLDDDKLAEHMRSNTFNTVVGEVRFGKGGEWAAPRVLQVQYQHIKGNDVAQFRGVTTQVVVAPDQYASGKFVYPYEGVK